MKINTSFSEADQEVLSASAVDELPVPIAATEGITDSDLKTDDWLSESEAAKAEVEFEDRVVPMRQTEQLNPKDKGVFTEPIDTIFTISGDTILCKIKTVTANKISYSVAQEGYATESSIPMSAAIKYVRGNASVSEENAKTEGKRQRLSSSWFAKATKIIALSTLAVGIALLVFFLLELDFALVLFLIFFSLLIVAAAFLLQTIFRRKIEKLEGEDAVGNAKKIRNKKIQALLSILLPIALTILGFGIYIIFALL